MRLRSYSALFKCLAASVAITGGAAPIPNFSALSGVYQCRSSHAADIRVATVRLDALGGGMNVTLDHDTQILGPATRAYFGKTGVVEYWLNWSAHAAVKLKARLPPAGASWSDATVTLFISDSVVPFRCHR